MNKSISSDFLNIMNERGFIHQITDKEKLDKELFKNSMTGYIGFDCTAPSLLPTPLKLKRKTEKPLFLNS